MNIAQFVSDVSKTYETGNATEHSYRASLENLLSSIDPGTEALNEPKHVDCGAPDFVVTQDDIVIGHVEAKNIDVPIRALKDNNKEQQERYRAALPNLIYTNCHEWDFYRDGALVDSVNIAEIGTELRPRSADFDAFENLLREFVAQHPLTITSPAELAERMAGKARLIKDVLNRVLTQDEDQQTELALQFRAFQENLIRDITAEDFADIYAETIAYGMFAARLHDKKLDTFSRHEALELLPKSNPFLRALFTYVAGYDLDDRLVWIIDDLANVFRACDVTKLMEGFGKLTGRNDPFLHFYETFLAAYNPKKRKARGVWYTPEPVVKFIVRAVDQVLQTEFGLADGLADTSKTTIDLGTGTSAEKATLPLSGNEAHRVQILDPATGTGTFLAEVIKQIAPKVQGIAPGMWSQYIEDDLIPRLHGFEILMASYAMCHMKLDIILTELGYKPTGNPPRLSVYLTNSLEEGKPVNQTDLAFTQWLSRESSGARAIKRDQPIMCVIGNPPYLGEGGASKGWFGRLMEDYKKEPGGKVKLKESNSKWINDLYVKFIRLSSHLIEKNGEGVLGFITNHGYLDNPTFRGMRWHLLKTFDRIWVIDLHGNAKKKEVTPEGKPDENVFAIQQGVAIIVCAKKKGESNGLAEVNHGDLWGLREAKYKALETLDLTAPVFEPLDCLAPQHVFVRRNNEHLKSYEKGFLITDLMPVNSVGIVTARDGLTIDESKDHLWERVQDFAQCEPEVAREKYNLGKDVQDWKVADAQKDLNRNMSHAKLTRIAYRPFDTRWSYYTGTSRGFMCRPRHEVMRHMLKGWNIAFSFTRTIEGSRLFADCFVFDQPITHHSLSIKEVNIACPLYLYPDGEILDFDTRRVSFDSKLYTRLQKSAKHPEHGTPGEVAVFDYIYGVLHCPAYRETYAEFLKMDFPRIPWPSNPDEFWDVSAKGTILRKLHLMEPEAIGQTPFPFVGEGDHVIVRPRYADGKVWINKTQYFDHAPEISWGFFIGGYQPAQKWLKDRKGQALDFDRVKHYQRILKILSETDRIMKTIEMDLG